MAGYNIFLFLLRLIFHLYIYGMNKTAIISGAGGALGSEIVQKFLNAGYGVDAFYHSQPKPVDHPSFKGSAVDLLDEKAVDDAVGDVTNRRGAIDVLVCAAGGFRAGNIENTSAEQLQRQYQLNFLTAYNLVRPVYDQMKKRGSGRIFLIGSRQGDDSSQSSNAVAYGLSKSLLFHLAGVLNTDSKGTIVVTVIVPSIIDTASNRESMPDADFSKWVSPDEIADIILFYSSKPAQAIRGPVVRVLGGS